MDTYFPKTRRPMAASSSLKRPLLKPDSTQKSKEHNSSTTSSKTRSTATSAVVYKDTGVTRKDPLSPGNLTTPTKQTCTTAPNKQINSTNTNNSPIYVDVTPPKARLIPTQQGRPVKRRILEPPGAPKKAHQRPAVFRQLFEHSKLKDLPKFDLSSPVKVFDTTPTKPDHPSSETTPQIISKRQILSSPIKRKEFTSPLKTKTSTPSSAKIENGPLKGVSTKILEYVRAREAAAKSVTPEQERMRQLLGIAPDIARIVPTIFTASKKEIIKYDKIVEHCCKSLKNNYASATIEECLTLMDTIAPEWTSTVTISRGKFTRLNRDNYTIPQLLDHIKRYKQKNC